MCSQRLFNFLLTKFEKDRDYTEFCDLVKMLMDFVYLRANVDKLRKGMNYLSFVRVCVCVCGRGCMRVCVVRSV